jgi:predicted permease
VSESVTGLLGDLRYALRTFRKSPGFVTAAVATLALAIGANAALFMVVDAVMLKALPVEAPDRLVLLSPVDGRGRAGGGFDYRTFEGLRERGAAVLDMFAFGTTPLRVGAAGQAEVLAGAAVSGSFFTTLGVRPALGRVLAPDDDRAGAPLVAVISDGYWKRRFGGDSGVLGRTIDIKRMPFRVVGVAPPAFSGIEPWHPCDVWVSMAPWPALRLKDNVTVGIMGRLRRGVTPAQAQAALTLLYRDALSAAEGGPSPERRREIAATSIVLRPGEKGTEDLREALSHRLLILMGAAGLLLLIACGNVANLQLARARSRQKEIAIRLALGAGRRRLIRQLVTESLLVALLGSAAGLLAASWLGGAALKAVADQPLPLFASLGSRVFLFTSGITLLAVLLFGVAPALRTTRSDLALDLRGVSQSPASRRRLPLGDGLVASQFALSLSLVIGAGLLARSLVALDRVDPGFRRDGVLLFWIYPTLSGIEGPAESGLYGRIAERLEDVPGVRSTTYFRFGFFAGRWKRPAFGSGSDGPGSTETVFFDAVGPRFFETMRVPLAAGRDFSARDDSAAPRVALVNRTAARRLFGEENPVGRRIAFDAPGSADSVAIIGVVGDTKTFTLRESDTAHAPGVVYVPVAQAPPSLLGQMNFAVRSERDSGVLAPGITRAVASVAPDLPVTRVRTLKEQMDNALGSERSLARFFSFFGALALLLAGVGLYGVMAHSVARRAREIGIRMALGATRNLVLRMVLRRGLILSLVGTLLGLLALPAVSRVLSSLLYGITPADPVTLVGAALVLAAISLVAAYVPARRATRVEPAEALRWE